MKILDFVSGEPRAQPRLGPISCWSQPGYAAAQEQHHHRKPSGKSFRKLRGPTYIAVIADELAFWFVDDFYVNPDVEILAAAKPGLMTTHGR